MRGRPRRPAADLRQLWDRAARVAGGLRAAGVQRGDRVAIRLGNGVDWVLAFFGALMAGAVAVPVNTRFTEEEVDYVVDRLRRGVRLRPGAALPDGDAAGRRRRRADRTSRRSSTPAAPPASPRAR